MKNAKPIIILLMIIIPIMMYVYLAGVNKGIEHTQQHYIDSVDNVLDDIMLRDTDMFSIEELRDFNLDVSDFDLEKFKLNNGFDLRQLYKDKIEFYTLDTMDIDNFNFDELELLGFNFYLYDLDTALHNKYYVLIGSKDFTKAITLYNELPVGEYIRSNEDLYKIVVPPTIMTKEEIIENVHRLNIRGKNIRMMILK